MKAYGGVDVSIRVFLTSTLVGGEWTVSRPGRFTPGKGLPLPIGWEAGWAPVVVWTTWRGEKSCPYRYSNSDPSAIQNVTSCNIEAVG
jgi:hypothetical protein